MSQPLTTPFELTDMLASPVAPIWSPKSSSYSLLVRIHDRVLGIVALVCVILLPVGAQVAACLKLASFYHWKWQVSLPGLLLLVTTLASFVAAVTRTDDR